MRVGVVMGLAVEHDMQAEALARARRFSLPTTPIVAIFNGHPAPGSVPIPEGVEVETHPARLGQERGLWRRAFEIALRRNWDWCVLLHDDLWLETGGWEATLADGERRWRVGVAGWLTSDAVDTQGDSGDLLVGGPLRLLTDGAAIAFNLGVYGPRGCFTPLEEECGYGDHEAVYYALSQRRVTLALPFPVIHRSWSTRRPLQLGTGENYKEIAARWGDVLPARILPDWRVEIAGEIYATARMPPGNMQEVAEATGTDKWGHGYPRAYRELIDTPPRRLLEIGVFRHESLALWQRYWPETEIHGFDLGWDEGDKLPEVTYWAGDQGDAARLREVAAAGPFELIVDDGSHEPEHQATSLAALWPAVAVGGWYIVEDVRTEACSEQLHRWWDITGARPVVIPSTDPTQCAVAYQKRESA